MNNPKNKTRRRGDRRLESTDRFSPWPPGPPQAQVVLEPPAIPSRSVDRWCRALNIAVAVIGLILAAPLLLIIAILIKVSSPGPVFFTQSRVGLDRRLDRPYNTNHRRRVDYGGKLFKIYKFRTMRVIEEDPQVWALPDDPRVTTVGRFLRRFRLDELPQLINVLKGEMNIVGPRPEQPLIFSELRGQVDQYTRRQRVLPGITGWAQINQSYDTSIADVQNKVRLDLEYIERRSWWEDLRIMIRTVPVMIFRKGGW
jgi:lipopolysaccharide/colanic/teichoic acid biosynthesis glycosyltransferase